MLSIASDFYSNLYQSADICDDNLLNYFLSRIELINIDEDCDIEYICFVGILLLRKSGMQLYPS